MNIVIRRTEPSDFEGMQKIFSGEKVIHGTLQLPFPSIETWRKRLAETIDGQFRLAATHDEELVGQIDLMTSPTHPRRRHVGQLGMAVRDDFQGQGVGSALMAAAVDMADNWLNLRRLELEVYTDNDAAIRLYKKFGFVVEGTLTQYAFRNGQYANVYAMARIKPER